MAHAQASISTVLVLLICGLCLCVQAWSIADGNANWQTMVVIVFTVFAPSQMAHVPGLVVELEKAWRRNKGRSQAL